MVEFRLSEIPYSDAPKFVQGHKFEVVKGEYIAEVPKGEAKQMAKFYMGSIKANSPKKEDKK